MTRPDPSLRAQGSVRTALRIIGPLLLLVGLALTIAGIADFFAAFGSTLVPRNFWMAFVGLPMLAVGIGITRVAFLGPATRYVAGEVTPTLRDTLGALGLSSAAACPACGAANDADARFCDRCGAALRVACPSCGEDANPGAAFCDHCGAPLAPR